MRVSKSSTWQSYGPSPGHHIASSHLILGRNFHSMLLRFMDIVGNLRHLPSNFCEFSMSSKKINFQKLPNILYTCFKYF